VEQYCPLASEVNTLVVELNKSFLVFLANNFDNPRGLHEDIIIILLEKISETTIIDLLVLNQLIRNSRSPVHKAERIINEGHRFAVADSIALMYV
jgi:hypothetical protein